MSRGMPLDDLMRDLRNNPEAAAAVQAQLRDPKFCPAAQPLGKTPKPDADAYRSKTESDYAAWLASEANVVWRYERLTVGLPGVRSTYKPDFTCRWTGVYSGPHELPHFDRYSVEVKGTKKGEPYWRDGARRRALDGAAELWDALRLPLVVAWKVKGVWKHERVPVRP